MVDNRGLIDANEAVSFLENSLSTIRQMDTNGNMQKYITLYEEVIDFIKKCPTVDAVEVVHGRLVPSIAKVDCTCSVCGTEFDNILSKALERWNYCPNCGAKMDGDGNV